MTSQKTLRDDVFAPLEDNLCMLRALSMTCFAALADALRDGMSNAGGRVMGTLLGGPSGDLARLVPGLSFACVTLVGDVVKCGGVIAIFSIGNPRSSASAARNASRAASLARAMASDIPTRVDFSYPPLSLFPTTRNVNSSSLSKLSSSSSSSSSLLLTAAANRLDDGPGDDANAATSRIARMFETDDDVVVAPIHPSVLVVARTIRPSVRQRRQRWIQRTQHNSQKNKQNALHPPYRQSHPSSSMNYVCEYNDSSRLTASPMRARDRGHGRPRRSLLLKNARASVFESPLFVRVNSDIIKNHTAMQLVRTTYPGAVRASTPTTDADLPLCTSRSRHASAAARTELRGDERVAQNELHQVNFTTATPRNSREFRVLFDDGSRCFLRRGGVQSTLFALASSSLSRSRW